MRHTNDTNSSSQARRALLWLIASASLVLENPSFPFCMLSVKIAELGCDLVLHAEIHSLHQEFFCFFFLASWLLLIAAVIAAPLLLLVVSSNCLFAAENCNYIL